jgi:hypothetical protein
MREKGERGVKLILFVKFRDGRQRGPALGEAKLGVRGGR